MAEIKDLLPKMRKELDLGTDKHRPCPIAAIRAWMEHLMSEEVLRLKDDQFKTRFCELFPPDVPDVCDLLDDILMNIKLKDMIKPMVARAYSCPKKYCEGWKTLIEQHLAAGHIQPLNLDYMSPAFIVPKADLNVLP